MKYYLVVTTYLFTVSAETVSHHEEIVVKATKEEILTEEHFECGIRPHVKSGRIVGGKESAFGAWPWQTLVRELDENGTFTHNYYGGVLISENFVLTVAHWNSVPHPNLAVVFGEHDISNNHSDAVSEVDQIIRLKKSAVVIKVKQIIIHPEFNNRTIDNDLALLRLEAPVRFDTHIVPICLPLNGNNFTRRLATVTGWGSLRYGGEFPTILQEVQVPILENDYCQELIQSQGYTKQILPSTLCAGYPKGEKDSCIGDSGGPLVVERSDGRWQLVGTVSNGIKCAFPRLPGIYMRITYYLPWIQSIINAP